MPRKIVSRSVLVKILNRCRNKKKIVFTNGCFDLLHIGHVRLLEKAKRLGDILVIGLNSDRSVRKLKGNGRPLIQEKMRAEVLSSLSCVDYITIFSEETPAKLIGDVKPDVLVKGSDYQKVNIVGNDIAKKVVRFPLVKNFSTTALIQKIARVYGR